MPQLTRSDMYEYWSFAYTYPEPLQQIMLRNTVKRQAVTSHVEAWISCFPSDIVEPGAVEAAKNDPYLGKGGPNPVFIMGPDDTSAGWISNSKVRAFLDHQKAKSVVLVSFGTLVDAGSGARILFEELVHTRTPFILAAGGQLGSLPEDTKALIRAAEADGRACAPEWLEQAVVLTHPVSRLGTPLR